MRKAMTPAKELQLKSILNDLKAAARKEDHKALLKADLELHQAIWKFSGRPELQRVLATIMNSRGFMILTMYSSTFPFSARYERHREYLDAVLYSPLDKVEAEVDKHFMAIYDHVFGGSLAQRLIASL